MKNLYAFFLLFVCSAISYAQPDRLIGLCQLEYQATWSVYTPIDSFTFLYNPGNMQTGSPEDYFGDSLRCDEKVHFKYHGTEGFYRYRQHYYEYDNNGRRVKETIKQQGSFLFENKYQIRYVYNAAGDEEGRYNFEWRGNTWDSTSRKVNTYDAAGNLLNTETWIRIQATGVWKGQSRTSYTYDAINRMDSCTTYLWYGNIQQFWPYIRNYYVYNAQNLIDTMFGQSHHLSAWEDDNMTTYTYNSASLPQLEKRFGKQATGWLFTEDYYTVYDAQNKVLYRDHRSPVVGTTERDSMEVVSTNPLVTREVHKDIYNGNGLQNRFMYERRADASGNWTMWFEGNWDVAQQKWITGAHHNNFYYGKGLGVGNTQASNIALSIYPNPAASYIIAQLPAGLTAGTAAIYDINGRLMQQQHVAAGTEKLVLPVAHLSAGTYTLSVSSGSERTTSRFVVQR